MALDFLNSCTFYILVGQLSVFIAKPSRRLGNQRVATNNLWRSPSFTLLLPFVHRSLICLRQQSVGHPGGRTDVVGNKSMSASDLGAICCC